MNEEYFKYLDELHASGEIDMWLAAEYLEKKFEITTKEARLVLFKWMKAKK
jgi:hypothetical protein